MTWDNPIEKKAKKLEGSRSNSLLLNEKIEKKI